MEYYEGDTEIVAAVHVDPNETDQQRKNRQARQRMRRKREREQQALDKINAKSITHLVDMINACGPQQIIRIKRLLGST